MYAEKNKLGVIIQDHPQITGFKLWQSGFWPEHFAVKNRFFFYGQGPNKHVHDVKLHYGYICRNIRRVAKEYMVPKLKIRVRDTLPSDTLVIHLRGGDVFRGGDKAILNYVQNPLSFYENLIIKFRKTIVVTEPGNKNPIAEALARNSSVIIQSSTIEEDFGLLLSAQNIASSGVGTFAVAAAICSTRIKNFYCSDAYLTEHLNPEMLGDINVHCTVLGDNYVKIGSWSGGDEVVQLMLNHRIDNDKFTNPVKI
jgi:hypothetical protein